MRQLLNCFSILCWQSGAAAIPGRVHKGPPAQQAHRVRLPDRQVLPGLRARQGRSRARAALASRDRYGHRSL
jgi:hypothetical protein